MMRTWLAIMHSGGRGQAHSSSALTTSKPRRKERRAATSFHERCELDDDAELGTAVNVPAASVNSRSKAYSAGYGDGAATAREEGAELVFSAQQAGHADEVLLNAVGLIEMARMLGVTKPAAGPLLTTTLEFRSACDEYNAGYAAGWEAEEIAALKLVAQF